MVTPDLLMLWLVDNVELVVSGPPLEMVVEELLVILLVEELLVKRTQMLLQAPRQSVQ